MLDNKIFLQGSRYKLTYDGMYHLDIPKTRQYDTGKVEIIARSSVGETLATTDLKVVQRKDDYRGVLKNSPRRKFLPLQIHLFAQKILTNITPVIRLHKVNIKTIVISMHISTKKVQQQLLPMHILNILTEKKSL